MTNQTKKLPYMRDVPIVKGSSREDLRDSLGSRAGHRLSATFRLESSSVFTGDLSCEFTGVINAMEWEDGSGDSWEIKGFVTDFFRFPELKGTSFKAHYNTNTRKGTLMWIK